MKLLIICAALLSSLFAAALPDEPIIDKIRRLGEQYVEDLGPGVSLLPDNYKDRAGNAGQYIDSYWDRSGLSKAVGADNEYFLRVCAACAIVGDILNPLEEAQRNMHKQKVPGDDYEKKVRPLNLRIENLNALYNELNELFKLIRP